MSAVDPSMSLLECHQHSPFFPAVLRDLHFNASIKILMISEWNFSGNHGIQLAECLKHNRGIESVIMSGCTLDADGAIRLAEALKQNTKIVKFSLIMIGICDDASTFRFVRAIGHSTSMKDVYFILDCGTDYDDDPEDVIAAITDGLSQTLERVFQVFV